MIAIRIISYHIIYDTVCMHTLIPTCVGELVAPPDAAATKKQVGVLFVEEAADDGDAPCCRSCCYRKCLYGSLFWFSHQ
jgi:nitrate reductase beta subunit